MKLRIFLVVLGLSLANARTGLAQVPSFDRVFIIVMENQEYESIIGSPSAPYINSLAQQYGLATNDYAPVHPSLPNYMALTGGETFFTTDCVGCQTPAPNIADRIEASGRSWMAYMEDMPAPCTATDSGLYVAKHNPFVHYTNIVSNAARCTAHVVPFSNFNADLTAGRLANFVWITPNLCNDMHDCSIATGDAWLSTVVPRILQSPAFKNSALFLTWDEGVTSIGGGGHIPLIVASARTPAGLRVSTPATHYSVLRTIEDAWGLPPLGQSAAATALSQFFPAPATPPAEQVIYAADVTTLAGAWQKVGDPTAAAGVKLATPDAGAATIAGPQVNPASYFEATFQASAATRYRVWLRLRAAGDSKWNDSVFVQFSDSVDSAGAAVYRIGTTTGYIVNLWPCATCQSIGWGWQRNAYWLSDSGDVWFPTGGPHKIRVQVREDGVEVDQIVISLAQYATAAPGPVSGDTTIVPKPSGPPPPPPEIVVYASDVGALHGAWTRQSDSTAAAGVTLLTPNSGVSSTAAPSASPTDYFEVTFSAPAATPYRVWLRLKALNNDKYNDSVWVQFSDALVGGSPVYAINSASGLLVNLATDSTAASLNGWGWQNGAYWLSQPTTVTFATSGAHTLRVQTREDGARIDQIVLSPSKYLKTAPGAVTNDATIVPK